MIESNPLKSRILVGRLAVVNVAIPCAYPRCDVISARRMGCGSRSALADRRSHPSQRKPWKRHAPSWDHYRCRCYLAVSTLFATTASKETLNRTGFGVTLFVLPSLSQKLHPKLYRLDQRSFYISSLHKQIRNPHRHNSVMYAHASLQVAVLLEALYPIWRCNVNSDDVEIARCKPGVCRLRSALLNKKNKG